MPQRTYNTGATASSPLFDRVFDDLRRCNHPGRLFTWARKTADRVYAGRLDYGPSWDDLLLAADCAGIPQAIGQRVIASGFAEARRALEVES